MKTKLTLTLLAALALSVSACKKQEVACDTSSNCRAGAEEVACGSSESDKCRSDQPGTVKACGDGTGNCRTEEDKKKQLQRTDRPAAPKGDCDGNC